MRGERAVLVLTDIPYNLGNVTSGDAIVISGGGVIRTKQGDWDEDFDLSSIVDFCAEVIDYPGSFYVCCAPEQIAALLLPFRVRDDCYGGQIIFEKTNPMWKVRQVSWRWIHENVAWARHKDSPWDWQGQERMSTVQRLAKATGMGHPTAKPVELFELFGMVSSREGDIVFDPFLGSGTTMVACERLGRRCRGIELDPGYCAVAIQRMADMGLDPRLLA